MFHIKNLVVMCRGSPQTSDSILMHTKWIREQEAFLSKYIQIHKNKKYSPVIYDYDFCL